MFLIYDFISVILGFSSALFVLILFLKSRNSRLLAYLWTETFIFLIVLAIALDFYLTKTGPFPRLNRVVWESIQFSCCGLCIWVPRICRTGNDVRLHRYIEKAFTCGGIILILSLASYFIFFGGRVRIFFAIYYLIYSELSLVCLYFAVSQIRFGRSSDGNRSLKHINSGLRVSGWTALVFLPLFIITDFFGWFLPLPFDMHDMGFSLLPAFNLVMSISIILGAAREFMGPYAVLESLIPDDEFISRYGLTRREAEVAPLVLECLTYKQISDKLCISPGTVRTHLNRIYSKTDTHNRLELSALLQSELKRKPGK